MKIVDEDTAILIAGEQIVVCRGGRFWWATGRYRSGRTILATNEVADPRRRRPAPGPYAVELRGRARRHRCP